MKLPVSTYSFPSPGLNFLLIYPTFSFHYALLTKRKEKKMRYFPVVVVVFLVLWCGAAAAQSPPYSKVTIEGETDSRFDKVSLFESGGSKKPIKTEDVSDEGEYSIDVKIPGDMRKKESYLFTDMRFWGDKNGNGIKDTGDPVSECHFIIWVPADNIVYMQVYQGESYPIESSVLHYDYDSE